MKIIGIDPGFERCGFAVLEKEGPKINLLTSGIIKTNKNAKFLDRQSEVADDFQALLSRYTPKVLSIEDLFFVQNITTGLKVAQVRGVLTFLAKEAGCKIVEPKPTEVKKTFCGDGKADKNAMKRMVKIMFNLEKSPKVDDVADAIAIAYFAAQNLDF